MLSAFATITLLLLNANSYTLRAPVSRRAAFATTATVLLPTSISNDAANAQGQESRDVLIATVKGANEALTSLLENWDTATLQCNYADVPRELLEAKNKDKLLEKASEFALFDKSTSVTSCKRSNRVVRDYIGVTGKGPLFGIEKKLVARDIVDMVGDPDAYFSALESFSTSMSRAASLSYIAGTSDFDSVNNFEQGKDSAESSNLSTCKDAIYDANKYLGEMISLLQQ